MLLFVLLSNFYGNKVQDIQIENYPTKIFLKKTEILFAFSNKDVPLHPVNKSLLPLQLSWQSNAFVTRRSPVQVWLAALSKTDIQSTEYQSFFFPYQQQEKQQFILFRPIFSNDLVTLLCPNGAFSCLLLVRRQNERSPVKP